MKGHDVEVLQGRVRDLEVALGQNDSKLSNTFKLTPNLANFLGLLLALPVVTAEIISERAGIASDAKVAKHRLQKELIPWDIQVHSKRLLGYWLDDDTKARIRALLDPPQGEPE
jgi:hypothetical protein